LFPVKAARFLFYRYTLNVLQSSNLNVSAFPKQFQKANSFAIAKEFVQKFGNRQAEKA
jgi:hypothetical protein